MTKKDEALRIAIEITKMGIEPGHPVTNDQIRAATYRATGYIDQRTVDHRIEIMQLERHLGHKINAYAYTFLFDIDKMEDPDNGQTKLV